VVVAARVRGYYAAHMSPLMQLAQELGTGRRRARQLTDECLERIADGSGQGAKTFLRIFAAQARAQADAVDRLRSGGVPVPLLAGIPVSVKDLFDISGEVTTAGSRVFAAHAPALADARVVSRLRAAGLIVLGRTNMTELAYSGVGLNPHFGTPLNPYDRATGRIPGGSSSGAAISVTDGMAYGALGTDTGGSCRIPAAFTGIVGFKPTACRVSRVGVTQLSSTLDSVGPLARTVTCCALLDAVISDGELHAPELRPVRGLRVLVPQTYVLDDLDAQVAQAFERSLSELSSAGAYIVRAHLGELGRLPQINSKGGFSAAESYFEYGALIEREASGFDPRVAVRILKGREQSAADYLELQRARAELQHAVRSVTATFDAVLMPTVPMIAPPLRELESDAGYFRANGLALRNPAVANFLDCCAISIPVQRAGEAPVGLMLMGEHGQDRALLAVARGVEELLSP